MMANIQKDFSLKCRFLKLLSTVTYPRCFLRLLFCFQSCISVGNIGFASGCTEACLSWHCWTDPGGFLYLALVRFQTCLLGTILQSVKCFLLLPKKHLDIYSGDFSAQKPTGHLEKCLDAWIGIHWPSETIHDSNGHSPWRGEI